MRFLKARRGNVIMTLIVGFVILMLGLASISFLNQMTKESEKRTLAIESGQLPVSLPSGTPSGVSGTAPVGIYTYSGIKPYVNFFFEDDVGTATNPTCYTYTDPAKSKNKEFWGDERRWADVTGDYERSGTATSGKLQQQWDSGKTLYMSCDISGSQDVFIEFSVPVRGDVSPGDAVDTNAGLSAGTYKTLLFDQIAWTGTDIDLGASTSANRTNFEHITNTLYTVVKNRRTCVDQVLMNITKYNTGADNTQSGVRKIIYELKSGSFLVYDKDGVDRTAYWNAGNLTGNVYDSQAYPSHHEKVSTTCYNADESINLRLRVWSDTTTVVMGTDTANNYQLADGNTTARIQVVDDEGVGILNRLING